MPKMTLKVEGKGNGIMTSITNLEDVAKALRVPVAYPHKFFGIELGSITKSKDNTYIVNGKHDPITMENILNKFIEKYVLCPVCKLPEISLKVKKDSIVATCHSCGKVSKMDTVHKLATFILKNPPKDESEFGKPMRKKPVKPDDIGHKKPKVGDSNRDKGKKGDEEEKLPEVLTLESPEVLETIKRIREYKETAPRNASELADQIANICISQSLKDDLRYYAAVHGLYDDTFLVQWNKEPSSKEALKILSSKEGKGQYWILLTLERFVLKSHPLQEHINTVLKCFYDLEILSEEVILKCYGKDTLSKTLASGKSYSKELHEEFKTKAAPFINWLKEAEEDDEEEEEEKVVEEDENVRRQKELIAEQQRLQEEQLKENKGKAQESDEKLDDAKTINILDIKTESDAATLDDL